MLIFVVYANDGESMSVSVWIGSDQLLENVQVAVGCKGTKSNFTLSSLGLDPSTDPREVTCKAYIGDQEYCDYTELVYLPENPSNGSSVKIDRDSGYLKVQYDAGGAWKTVMPYGFYDVGHHQSLSLSRLSMQN